MKPERKWIPALFLTGIFCVFLDVVFDYFFFYAGNGFLDLLILNVPPHESWIRLLIVIFFTYFGVVVARVDRGRRRAEGYLRESESKLRRIVEHAPLGYQSLDAEGKVLDVNPAWSELTGYSTEESLGCPITDFLTKESSASFESRFSRLQSTGEVHGAHFCFKHKGGTELDVEITARAEYNDDGKFVRSHCLLYDVSMKEKKSRELKHSERRYHELFSHIRSGVAVYEAVGNGEDFLFRDFNKAGERIEKIQRERVLNRRITEVFPAVSEFGLLDILRRVWKTGNPETLPVALYKDDRISGWRENYVYKLPSGEVVAVYEDVTEQKQSEEDIRLANEHLKLLTTTDPLTGCLNRRGLEYSLKKMTEEGVSREQSPHAFLIDLDNFKNVNETFGYGSGDNVLRSVCKKCESLLRPADCIGRIGGDEFMLLLPGLDREESLTIADRIRREISKIIVGLSRGSEIILTVSIGIVFVRTSNTSLEELIERTYYSLNQSKSMGKNIVTYQDKSETSHVGAGKVLSHVLGNKPDENKIHAVWQPIFKLDTHEITAYEMLSRLHPSEQVEPTDLFRMAMEGRVLTFVDRLCLRVAVKASRRFPKEQMVHLNLFPTTLVEIQFEELLSELRSIHPDGSFCVEISEQQIMGDPGRLIQVAQRLQANGIKIALDDVGFGKSCVENLVLLSPDFVKIDKSCIDQLDTNASKLRSFQRIIKIVRSCDSEIIAEGVETEGELKTIMANGINYAQGHYLGRPTSQDVVS